ncbi:hypothetical protein GGI07_004374 [Coemansia sp. Benny D115]|nr:hypothetical protein GGI07_004374 [Coemansia sp. Benny D115]
MLPTRHFAQRHICSTLSRATWKTGGRQTPTMLLARYSSNLTPHDNSGVSDTKAARQRHNRNIDRNYGHNDDRMQYDMKAPQLDAGFANIFQVDENMLSIVENLPTGFRLNNGAVVYGPLLIVNNEAFTLNIPPPKPNAKGQVVNPVAMLAKEVLEVLDVVTPKPELVVVGGGARLSPLSKEAKAYLTSIGLNVELANTRYATSTFNTLSEEGRNAALLALPAGVVA